MVKLPLIGSTNIFKAIISGRTVLFSGFPITLLLWLNFSTFQVNQNFLKGFKKLLVNKQFF